MCIIGRCFYIFSSFKNMQMSLFNLKDDWKKQVIEACFNFYIEVGTTWGQPALKLNKIFGGNFNIRRLKKRRIKEQ